MIQLPTTLPRWLAPLLFSLALIAALWRAPSPTPPEFALPAAAVPSNLPASFHIEQLPRAAESAHAATLTQLPDGRIAAAWFAGSREGAADVAIWFSTRDKRGWSKPAAIASRESTAGGTFATTGKPGGSNPAIR